MNGYRQVTYYTRRGGYYWCTLTNKEYLSFGFETYNHRAGEVFLCRDDFDSESDYNNAALKMLDAIKKQMPDFYRSIYDMVFDVPSWDILKYKN